MDAVVARSRHDVQWLRDQLPGVRVELLPPWFEGLQDLADLPAERPPSNDILFVGAMHLSGNAEAVLAFAHETLPLIRASVADARLLIVGGNPCPELVALHDGSSIIVTGYVDDLTEWYRRAAVVIAPLRRAGGILVKVLNGLAAARPVVASSAANWGVAGHPGVDLIIADHPADESQYIVRLLRDIDYWRQLALAGRRFVQANYDWGHAMRSLEQLYASVTENN
jgi:glycosyltransferase involved in cell wall biosynthesis